MSSLWRRKEFDVSKKYLQGIEAVESACDGPLHPGPFAHWGRMVDLCRPRVQLGLPAYLL